MTLLAFQAQPQRSLRCQLTDHVRQLVLRGEVQPGERLPTTQQLATLWSAPVPTVHQALTPLVKEGLLERTPRLGTFVRARRLQVQRVAIYLSRDFLDNPQNAFGRALCAELQRLLSDRSIATEAWLDTRPEEDQYDAWPELAQASAERRFDALLVPGTDRDHALWLSRLPVPVAVLSSGNTPRRVTLQVRQIADLALRELARQGCRRVGVIGAVYPRSPNADGTPHESVAFWEQFPRTARALGMEWRPEWAIRPPEFDYLAKTTFERFGYDAVQQLWALPRPPDGLVVYTDFAARGALLALLQRQVRIPEQLRLVLHRNAELGLLCPVPASFLEVRITEVAAALLTQIDRQIAGEEIATTHVPFHLVPPAVPHQP